MENRENNLAWWIAGILLVLLIIVGYLWLSSRNDLNAVLENGKNAIAAERDQISVDCQGAKMNRDACNRDLTDLTAILKEFSQNLETATTSTNATTSASV